MSGRWLPEAEGGFGWPRGVMGGTPGGQEAGEETGLQHRGARRATGAGAEPRTKQQGGGNAGPSQPLKAPRAAAVRKGKRRCSSSRSRRRPRTARGLETGSEVGDPHFLPQTCFGSAGMTTAA